MDPVGESAPVGRREANRRRRRQAIIEVAWRLFLEDGFAETTVDHIATEAGVAPRTFFRYFSTKEAVLFADTEDDAAILAGAIDDQPPELPPVVALRRAFQIATTEWSARRDILLLRARVGAETPEVYQYSVAVARPAIETAMTERLAARLGVDPLFDMQPVLLTHVGIAALTAGWTRWYLGGGTDDLAALVDQEFTRIPTLVAPLSL